MHHSSKFDENQTIVILNNTLSLKPINPINVIRTVSRMSRQGLVSVMAFHVMNINHSALFTPNSVNIITLTM